MSSPAIMALLLALSAACGGHTFYLERQPTLTFQTMGSAHVWRDHDGRYRLEVDVYRLPSPQLVCQGGCADFVVWAREQKGTTRNLGNLSLYGNGDDALTGVLKSRLPEPQCEIFITAEPTTTVTTPSREPLLSVRLKSGREPGP